MRRLWQALGAKVLEASDIGRAVVYALLHPEFRAFNEIVVESQIESTLIVT
jgi:hypothetical protein